MVDHFEIPQPLSNLVWGGGFRMSFFSAKIIFSVAALILELVR